MKKSTSLRNKPCPCGSGQKFKYCHGAPQGRQIESKREELFKETDQSKEQVNRLFSET